MLKFVCFSLSISFFLSQTNAGLEDCLAEDNITLPEFDDRLTNRHHRLIETCLYYELSLKEDKKTGRSNSLAEEAPLRNPADTIIIDVDNTILREMHDPTDSLKSVIVDGEVDLSWQDTRLVWDPSHWRKETLKIQYSSDIWVPDLVSKETIQSDFPADITYFLTLHVNYRGFVTGRFSFFMEADCIVDYTQFPSDEHYCCSELHPRQYRNKIEFVVKRPLGEVDKELYSKLWTVQGVTAKTVEDEGFSRSVKVCFMAARISKTLKLALTLPVSIVAILVVLSPLFGSITKQNYVKMFTLFMQYLCFQGVIQQAPAQGFGDTTPRIFRFYEFSISVTLFSLVVGVVLAAVGRLERKIPPAHQMYLFATAINSKLCCGEIKPQLNRASQYQMHDNNEAPVAPEGGTNYASDWLEVFTAINNMFSGVLLIIYVFGFFVLGP